MNYTNFKFLKKEWPMLYQLANFAEEYLYYDTNSAIIKLRIFAEELTDLIIAFEKLEIPEEDNQFNKLNFLERKKLLPSEILKILHTIRKNGNQAVHDLYDSVEDAKILLSLAYKLGVFFCRRYSSSKIKINEFKLPKKEKNKDDIKKVESLYEKKLNELEKKLAKSSPKNDYAVNEFNDNKESEIKIELSTAEKKKILEDKYSKLMKIYNTNRKFITGSNIKDQKLKEIWKLVKQSFYKRKCIAYFSYPLYNYLSDRSREVDILIVDREYGIILLNILRINDYQEQDLNLKTKVQAELETADKQLLTILNYCDREKELFRKIGGRTALIIPDIDNESKAAARLSESNLIFSNHLNKNDFLKKINENKKQIKSQEITDQMWKKLLSAVTGQNTYKNSVTVYNDNLKSRAAVKKTINEKIYQVDLQQEEIAKTIPPGAQRIRGIAGSGKTVVLAQKAAHMHLKHPDWKIAFIFFTRSLYDAVISEVKKWVKHFSSGQKEYIPAADNKLQILHAWGSKKQQGFYRLACKINNLSFYHAGKSELGNRAPNLKLIKACQLSLREAENIEESYDALLIDEAQDLISDSDSLKYQDKQPFFWLAYKSLKNAAASGEKRLIWAYDEAQTLNSLKAPTAAELFGSDPKYRKMVSGFHQGGIPKSEIMSKCYRTPGPILTAAHALGMGLLREKGMLTGFTTQEDWSDIGYEVEKGSFNPPGQEIILKRSEETTPNRVPDLWEGSVIDLNIYNNREDELAALIKNLKYNLAVDRLEKSRDILIIALGDYGEAVGLQKKIAKKVKANNIDFFIPKAVKKNQLDLSNFHNTNPNNFWHKNAVTISNIFRAKGNESYMVYLLGLDHIAAAEAEIAKRNQLFVALSRSKAWVSVSGIGDYSFYNEFKAVLKSGSRFKFTFKRPKS